MIWLAWRQARSQMLIATVAVIALAAALLGNRSGLENLYHAAGLDRCHPAADCPAQIASFLAHVKADSLYPALYFLALAVLLLAPALAGAFWGAPLLTRELETDTLRLAWSQSVTRRRWILTRLAVTGGASVIAVGLLSALLTWWAEPIDSAGGLPTTGGQLSRFTPQVFDARGLTPLAYTAFAFTLGVMIGLIVRRTVPAIAISLGGFGLAQYVTAQWVRPRLFHAHHLISAPLDTATLAGFLMNGNGQLTLPPHLPGAWIITNQTITPSGQTFTLPTVPACQTGTQQQCLTWLGGQHLRQALTFQPASRFWDFQLTETLGYLALTVVLAAITVRYISRNSIT